LNSTTADRRYSNGESQGPKTDGGDPLLIGDEMRSFEAIRAVRKGGETGVPMLVGK